MKMFSTDVLTRRTLIKSLGTTVVSLPVLGLPSGEEPDEVRTRVILCYDGSKNHAKLQGITEFGDELSKLSELPARFTIYANSAYWHTGGLNGSDIGYGGTEEEIQKRIELTQKIIDAGHEMGSHTVRHRNGKKWSFEKWNFEISEFDRHVAERFRSKDGKPYKCRGFRAPYLAWNKQMYRALKNNGYVYDVSQVGKPTVLEDDIIQISVPLWRRKSGRYLVSMDYNWQASKIGNNELEELLENERNNSVIILSMHFENYKSPDSSKTYEELIQDFCRTGAREKRFQFISMATYAEELREQFDLRKSG